MPDDLKTLLNTYRTYFVEVKADTTDGEATRLDNRWYPKSTTKLKPGKCARKEAQRLAKLYGVNVRLILHHPVPPPVCIATAVFRNLKRKGDCAE